MTASGAPSQQPDPASDFGALKPSLSHVAYHVSDIDRALAFYVGVLGMKEQMRFPIGNGLHEAVLAFPEGRGGGLLLMWNVERPTTYQLGDGYSRLVINVSDLDRALAHVASHGTPVVQPAKQNGPFHYALVKDPDGYVIELLCVKRA